MIDASKGFMKDGPKNRLRSQDIHKIVDVFNKQTEIERYSRMVPLAEIAEPKNDYNLNIPRYIDSSEPEDIQDLHAHLHGGIPERDIDALSRYWDAFPQLRATLFKPNRPGYGDLAIDVTDVQQTVLDSAEFQKFAADVARQVDEWFAAHRATLAAITPDTQPNELIATLGDDLLARFKPVPLLDEYDVYEQLMSYWHETHARRRLPHHERGLGRRRQAADRNRGQGPQALRDARPRHRHRQEGDQVQDGPDPAGAHRRPLLRRRAGGHRRAAGCGR